MRLQCRLIGALAFAIIASLVMGVTNASHVGAVSPAATNLLDCKYSPRQVTAANAYFFLGTLGVDYFISVTGIGPTKQTASPPTSELGAEAFDNGDYFQFFPSTTVPGSFGVKLVDVNGTLKRVVHETGSFLASGEGFILYNGNNTEPTAFTSASLGSSFGARIDAVNLTNTEAAALTRCRTAPLGNGTWMRYHPLTASRVYDSRNSTPLAPNVERAVGIGGVGQVPATAGAAMLNITITNPVADGWMRVGPCGWPDGGTSTVNYEAGQTIANASFTTIGRGGAVCAMATTATDLIIDVAGYGISASGSGNTRYRPLPPTRVADTRYSGTRLAAGAVLTVPLHGVPRVPTAIGEMVAAAMTVTVTEPVDGGFVTVFACGTNRPDTSNVNYGAEQSIANSATTLVGAADEVCVYTSTATHVVVDLTGIYATTARALFDTLAPTRLADTRTSGTLLPAGGVLEVATDTFVPVSDQTLYGAVINLTVTQAADGGYLTAYPCGATRPWASSINFRAGQTVASMAMARVGTGNKICIYAAAPAHVIVDMAAAVTVFTSDIACLSPDAIALLRAAADDEWLKPAC